MLGTGLRAAEAVSPENPYVPVVTRNVFDIHPPPPTTNPAPDVAPPPKITPNGIMGVYGHLQVLFKVVIPPKPGQPGKEQSYILGESQQQDDIEVTKIDDQAGIVTFNNHGTVQALPLVTAPAVGTSAPVSSGPGPNNIPKPGFAPGGGNPDGVIRFGKGFGQSGANGGGSSNPQPQNTMSVDDQGALITARHALAVAQHDPLAVIFPPTPFDAEAGVPSNLAPTPPVPGGPPQP